jgi:hypothetical protein
MKIYCDTDTLFSNIKRHENQAKEKGELEALKKLLACHRAGKIVMFGSLLNLRELEETKKLTQREKLGRSTQLYHRCRRMRSSTEPHASLLIRTAVLSTIR